jgi:peptidoglycan/xylan/chitin deacetylase (PgdA/CDA1 family)
VSADHPERRPKLSEMLIVGLIGEMATVVTIMDRRDWAARTDIIVVVDPSREVLRWIPRDLWCDRLGDRINTAFRRAAHPGLISALGEHGIAVEHSLCLRRDATDRAIHGLTVTVPVPRTLEFWYPLSPRAPIEDGRKLIAFHPPHEVLAEERIHQWIGARYSLRRDTTDFDRIRRQQVLLRRLLEERFDFKTVLSDPELVDSSSEEALYDLSRVNGSWRFDMLDDVIDARVDGKAVLLERGRPGQLRRRIPILMYHRIGNPPRNFRWPGLYVKRKDLARQLDKLGRDGYTAVTQRDLYDGWNAVRALPEKPVVLTFDDGHISVWDQAFPLLRSRRWPAVLNLPLSMLDSPIGLSSGMVRELIAAGWELGAHSRTHPDLTQLDEDRLESEVCGSRSDLAERFEVPVDFFCYPSGRFSPDVKRTVVQAGYLGATTTEPGLAGPDDPYAMPRVRVSRGDSARQLAERLAQLQQHARLTERA